MPLDYTEQKKQFERETKEWKIPNPYKRALYVAARLKGSSPGEAYKISTTRVGFGLENITSGQ